MEAENEAWSGYLGASFSNFCITELSSCVLRVSVMDLRRSLMASLNRLLV